MFGALSQDQVRRGVQEVRRSDYRLQRPSGRPEICDSCFKGRNADRNAALVAMWEAGANSREVAERFGMDESAVGSFLNSLRQRGVNVPMHTLPHRDYEERYRQMVDQGEAGCTNKEIAAEIGSTRGSVVHMIYVARRKGFEIPARR